MKTIAVFGGTSGLGVKLVPLLEEKYRVISLGSKDVDVTYFGEVKKFFEGGEVDIVLNLAGISYDVYLSRITEDDYKPIIDMLDVNIMGLVNILAGCLPHMVKKKWGRVITISSVLSEMNVPKASLYSASKAFVDRLISSANKENIKYGVTCNSIQLGYWDGGMCERLDPVFREKVKDNIGLKRWGTVEELHNTINYLVDNEYVCGVNLKLDGGL